MQLADEAPRLRLLSVPLMADSCCVLFLLCTCPGVPLIASMVPALLALAGPVAAVHPMPLGSPPIVAAIALPSTEPPLCVRRG